MSTILQKNLRTQIQLKAISVHALEIKAGLKPSAVQNILQGKSKKPAADLLVAVARVLDCSVEELISDPHPTIPLHSSISSLLQLDSVTFNSINPNIETQNQLVHIQKEQDLDLKTRAEETKSIKRKRITYNPSVKESERRVTLYRKIDSAEPGFIRSTDDFQQYAARHLLTLQKTTKNPNQYSDRLSIHDIFTLNDPSKKMSHIPNVKTKGSDDNLQTLYCKNVGSRLECFDLEIPSQSFNLLMNETWLLSIILLNLNKVEFNSCRISPVPKKLGFRSLANKYIVEGEVNLELRPNTNNIWAESIVNPANLFKCKMNFNSTPDPQSSGQKLSPSLNKPCNQWIPDLYIDCFVQVQQILDSLEMSLNKVTTLKIVDQAYLYSIEGSMLKADLKFINWSISKHLHLL